MPTDAPPPEPGKAGLPGLGAASDGVLIRADNGDVVTFDDTGLTLRLSDSVVADLRRRLQIPTTVLDAADHLGDIDAWNLRQDGGWLRFTGLLEPGTAARDYQRPLAGGNIIAAAPGPLYGLLSLGGARRAGFNDGPSGFPFHILAPGDDIGAVGLEGTGQARPTERLQHLAHCSRDALIAETLLEWRRNALRGLPLFMARAETDASPSITALGEGPAYANFLVALDSLVAAAANLGKRARVLAVGIDYSLEDQTSSTAEFATGLRSLMARIERDMGRRDLQRPVFLATFEAGTQCLGSHPAMAAHWELAWSHGAHQFAFSAPGYMFEQTRFGRPTPTARLRMAEMDAHAIVALSNREPWACPLFLLAEYQGCEIRVTGRAATDLVLEDAFGAGPSCGFAVSGTDAPQRVLSVAVAADDPQALILTCDGPLGGDGAVLHYAHGATGSSPDAFPVNRGSVRDQWRAASRTGADLHRWALPAVLPLRRGAA